jgi:hypothetical protein
MEPLQRMYFAGNMFAIKEEGENYELVENDLKKISAGLSFAANELESLIVASNEPAAPTNGTSGLLAAYAANFRASEKRPVGTSVLMMPVFDDGNYNRSGKKIRVAVEEPIGKYRIFSHEEYGSKELYFLTASGRIDRTSTYFRDEWD